MNVAVLGASDNPGRYSYKAMTMLTEHGHSPLLVHPTLKSVLGLKCYNSLQELIDSKIHVDTLTMYVGPAISSGLQDVILALRPDRVIFNPGSENRELEKALKSQGIEVEEACTLVLLSTGQF